MLIQAINLAKVAHREQTRGNGIPYIVHPARVAMAVSLYPYVTEEMIAAAWLHDTIEDTYITYKHIVNTCDSVVVADLVKELTFRPTDEQKSLPYRDKKLVQNNHIAAASKAAKIIKIYDRIDNLTDFADRAAGFLFPGGPAEKARNRLVRYLDVSWELVKLLSQQEEYTIDHDVLTELRALCLKIANGFELNIDNL